jgi:hypothetical protein
MNRRTAVQLAALLLASPARVIAQAQKRFRGPRGKSA